MVTADAVGFVPPQKGIATVTIRLVRGGRSDREQGGCITAEPAAWNAFAILAGIPAQSLAGTEFLIDPDGWLRSVHWPDDADGWHTPDDLLAAVQAICASPVARASGALHEHHH